MKRKSQTRSLPPVYGRCTLAADSIDRERRQVEATFLSGQPIARFPLFDDAFWLEFAMVPKAADFARVRAGNVPVLDSHQSFGVASVLGRVESARIIDGQARAVLRFSKRADLDSLWADIEDGILTGVSAGVVLHDVEEAEQRKGDDMRRFIAKRWELMEVSVVGVPADAGARIEASAEAERHACRLSLFDDGGKTMRKRTRCPACREKLSHEGDEELVECGACGANLSEAQAEVEELARKGRIHELAEWAELGDTWAQRHIKLGSTIKEAEADARRERAARVPEIDGRNFSAGADHDSLGSRIEQMGDALAARGRGVAPSERGRRYAHTSIADCAYACLEARGLHRQILDPRRSPGRVVELALTSSDFPNLLANVLNKQLMPAYMAATPTFRAIGRERTFNDYRPHPLVRVGEFPPMLVVGESGEITEGAIGDAGETVTALAYGRIVNLTRRVLIDDNVSAFSDLTMAAGRRVADVQNTLFMNACILPNAGLGPVLADGVQLHNATHANVCSAGALDVARIGEARSLMMRQRGLPSQAGAGDGVFLNNQPRYVLVAPGSLTLAEQLTTSIQPVVVSEVNPFAARLIALGDANLGAGARYYLIADPAVLATFVFGSIGGEGPRVAVREGFEVEGVAVRISFDFAAGAADFRGTTTGAGA